MERFTRLFRALRALSLILAVAAATAGVATSEVAGQEILPETPRQLRAVMLNIVFSGITTVGAEVGQQSAHMIVEAVNEAVSRVESDGMPPELVSSAVRNTRYFTTALLRAGDVVDGRVSLGESAVDRARNFLRGFCPIYPWC